MSAPRFAVGDCVIVDHAVRDHPEVIWQPAMDAYIGRVFTVRDVTPMPSYRLVLQDAPVGPVGRGWYFVEEALRSVNARPPTSPQHSVDTLTHATTQLLSYLDPDPFRGGLKETPERAAKAWAYWTSGYKQDPAEVLKVFEDGAEAYDEMVVVQHIPIYSHCEHHLAPIFGHASIAYIPDGRIVGLSKLNRLAQMFALRLQVQERMTAQIADALQEHLKPKGCGVTITARHFCMESRGVKQNSETTTSALRGVFTEGRVRAEYLSLVRENGA